MIGDRMRLGQKERQEVETQQGFLVCSLDLLIFAARDALCSFPLSPGKQANGQR